MFGFTSRFAPEWTGRTAFKLFCRTSNSANNSAKLKKTIIHAQQMFAQANQHTLSYSGGHVTAFEFPAIPADKDSGTVLVVHGWQSSSHFMKEFVNPIRQNGFQVVLVDLPGHGKSSGRVFHLPLAVEALQAVFQKFKRIDRVISHSLGGAVVSTAVAGTIPHYPALDISKLVLISSPNSMVKIFDDFTSMVNLGPKAVDEVHAIVKRLSDRSTSDFCVSRQINGTDVDVCVIHAPDDKEVPFSEAEAIDADNANVTLTRAPGLGHRRIIRDPFVIDAAVSFVCN